MATKLITVDTEETAKALRRVHTLALYFNREALEQEDLADLYLVELLIGDLERKV